MASKENKERRYQLIAALLTLLITVGTLALLWYAELSFKWPPEEGARTVAQQDSILYGGEFVQLGDLDFLAEDEMAAPGSPDDVEQPSEPSTDGDAPEDNGNEAEQEKPKVTQDKPSPAKETKKEQPKDNTGTAEKKDEQKPEQKKKNDKATDNKKATPDNKNNNKNNQKNDKGQQTPGPADGKFSQKGSGGGRQGSRDGNSDTGLKTGVGSIGSGLAGYGPKSFPKPHGVESGTVIVRVRVKADGKVHSAERVGGTIKNAAQQQDCINKALASQFSVPKDKITEGLGTIVYIFPK